jgi:hypothetical protein
MGILSDICNVIRGATNAHDYEDLLLQADKLLNTAVNHVHAESDEGPYMKSFAHSDAHPEVVVSLHDDFESILGTSI